MTYAFAAFLGLHGVVHALGFVSTWKLGHGASAMSPTLLPGLDPDGMVSHGLGLVWLLGLAVFVIAGVGLAIEAPWWRPLAATAAALSLVLCAIWWNDARVGAAIDIAILVGLASTVWVAHLRTLP
jgi:hypothetical protein